jgi:hypothetical protein
MEKLRASSVADLVRIADELGVEPAPPVGETQAGPGAAERPAR